MGAEAHQRSKVQMLKEEPWIHERHLQQYEQEVAWHQAPPVELEHLIERVAVSCLSTIQPCNLPHPAFCMLQKHLQDLGPAVRANCGYSPSSLAASLVFSVHPHSDLKKLQPPV